MTAVFRVALPVPLLTLFDYLPPEAGIAQAGSRVRVPFGRGEMVGVVIDPAAEASVGVKRLKQASEVLDDAPLLDAELLATLAWAADYWAGAPGEAFANALPLALREPRPLPATGREVWALTTQGRSARDARSRKGGSAALLEALVDGPRAADELGFALPERRA